MGEVRGLRVALCFALLAALAVTTAHAEHAPKGMPRGRTQLPAKEWLKQRLMTELLLVKSDTELEMPVACDGEVNDLDGATPKKIRDALAPGSKLDEKQLAALLGAVFLAEAKAQSPGGKADLSTLFGSLTPPNGGYPGCPGGACAGISALDRYLAATKERGGTVESFSGVVNRVQRESQRPGSQHNRPEFVRFDDGTVRRFDDPETLKKIGGRVQLVNFPGTGVKKKGALNSPSVISSLLRLTTFRSKRTLYSYVRSKQGLGAAAPLSLYTLKGSGHAVNARIEGGRLMISDPNSLKGGWVEATIENRDGRLQIRYTIETRTGMREKFWDIARPTSINVAYRTYRPRQLASLYFPGPVVVASR